RQGAPDDDSTGSGAGADPANSANSANPADTDGRPAKDEENVVASSDAFDFTQSIEGKPVFKVHGDRFRTTRDGKVELEGVNFEIFRDSTSYSVASDTATYDSNSQEALLTGNVRLTGGELGMESGALQLSRGGKFLRAEGPIALRHGLHWKGAASGLEFDVALDLLTLRGPVVMSGGPPEAEPMSVEAGKVVLDRSARVLRAKGDVRARRGASHFAAHEAELLLAEDGETPAALLFEGALAGTYITAGAAPADPDALPAEGADRIDFRGVKLTIQFGAGGVDEPREMSLEGRGKNLALIESVDGEIIHGLASRALWLKLEGGRPRSANSTEPVYFAEYHRGVEEPMRSGRADRAEAEFGAAGGISRVVLIGGVTLTDPKFKGWGEQALFDFDAGRSELLGAPARTESASGELVAPHIVYARKTGLLTADRGVRGVLQRGGGSAIAGVGFRGDQPIEFQAEEAIFTDAPRGFFLKGKVRAWQGKSLLLANQVNGEESEARLSAAGAVRTLIDLQKDTPTEMTEVIADFLTYRKQEASVTFTGGVRLTQGTRTLTCDELVADLDEAQQMRSMRGTGKVRLRDTLAGRSIEARTATYDVGAESIELRGEPVTMIDDTGATLKGKRALYDLKSSSARLAGAAQ
ncbi:MAG: OstA-like protein, partial [Acidobacteriota bacterium]|nr:OstA-like protein [Acidobacteriota bacterium]